jgi:hypothetical protein
MRHHSFDKNGTAQWNHPKSSNNQSWAFETSPLHFPFSMWSILLFRHSCTLLMFLSLTNVWSHGPWWHSQQGTSCGATIVFALCFSLNFLQSRVTLTWMLADSSITMSHISLLLASTTGVHSRRRYQGNKSRKVWALIGEQKISLCQARNTINSIANSQKRAIQLLMLQLKCMLGSQSCSFSCCSCLFHALLLPDEIRSSGILVTTRMCVNCTSAWSAFH